MSAKAPVEREVPVFHAAYAPDDNALVAKLLGEVRFAPDAWTRITEQAGSLIAGIRTRRSGVGGLEDFMHDYGLSTPEGLALMTLAESLLRIPDAATADQLIEEKLGTADWHLSGEASWLVSATSWALGLTARVVHPSETPEAILFRLAKRLGMPAIRTAARQSMRVLGHHFVLGETIGEALTNARAMSAKGYRHSFDMLGEGARTMPDAERYLGAYLTAVHAAGEMPGGPAVERPGISVKLSALHPRYVPRQRERVLRELVPRLAVLCRAARDSGVSITLDAEEADRLELSLEVLAALAGEPSLGDWQGLGLAVQAYQKRAVEVVDWVAELARGSGRRISVRLVKGAYWDTEIKRAQERGLADFPVFSRKAATDLSYLACAKRLLSAGPEIFPQFATHNALTAASIIEMARGREFEFQRLHGMGEGLYAQLHERDGFPCRIYAPVGGHRELLAYLVRRLLENGANSSFVKAVNDADTPIGTLLTSPMEILGPDGSARHPKIALPGKLFGERKNSRGVEFGDRYASDELQRGLALYPPPFDLANPIVDGADRAGSAREIHSRAHPIRLVGTVEEADEETVSVAVGVAAAGFGGWEITPAKDRAGRLERAADLIEERRSELLSILAHEGGKTVDDGISEIREAADFCRYYAAEARRLMGSDMPLPGPTGEENRYRLRGRGVFACISPWNFPLSIFLGQVTAALAAGNTVVAKPAEQTPFIAAAAVRLLFEAGIPTSALQLLPGDGKVGAGLVRDPRIAGVVFTGSTEVGRSINQALAAKAGPIVPLISETGGINAFVVDASALPEQVTDDVITSAFRSAGQRCSATRILFVQEEVADDVIAMIAGAAAELVLGDPADPATDIGPVIDAEAKRNLEAHIERMRREQTIRFAGPAPKEGLFVAPHLIELSDAAVLDREVFGPILHVVRWRAEDFASVIAAVKATGYGLTFGVHTRLRGRAEKLAAELPVGNVYVNRSMIGAVVGSQPFGGMGLSGTGPKAGGPNYLQRFTTEEVVATDTTAAGGNASLVTMADED